MRFLPYKGLSEARVKIADNLYVTLQLNLLCGTINVGDGIELKLLILIVILFLIHFYDRMVRIFSAIAIFIKTNP